MKLHLTASIACVCAALSLAPSMADALDLTANDYSIVVGENPGEISKFAAKELQYYIEKATSKKLPIKKESEIGDKPFLILVGPSKFTGDMKTDKASPDSFTIKTQGERLFLIGDDLVNGGKFACRGEEIPFAYVTSHKGTLFAVYTFLEKFVGVRWFWPGESGETVPKLKSLPLPSIDIAQKPDFLIRDLWLEFSWKGDWAPIPENVVRSEYPLWHMRNKLGKSISCYFGHSWAAHITNDHFKEHPEYYPLINGQRRPEEVFHSTGKLSFMNNQVCTSNPDVQKLFLESIKARSKPDDPSIVSISPNDGVGFCECDKCRSQDAPAQYAPEALRYQVLPLSNRTFKYFINPIAKELKASHPNLRLGIMAYTYLTEPPTNIDKLEDNIVIGFCQISGFYNDPEAKRKSREFIDGWKKLAASMSCREYYGDFHWQQLPHPQTRTIAEDIAYLKASGFIGLSSEDSLDFSTNHLNYYVAAKLLWDSSLKLDDILDDYYRNAYGDAAPKAREYLELMERTFNSRYPAESAWNVATLFPIWTPDVIEKGYALLLQAEKATDDRRVKDKIAFLRAGHEYTDKFATFLALCKRLRDEGLAFDIKGYKNSPPGKEASKEDIVKLVKDCHAAKEGLFAFITKHRATPAIQENILLLEDRISGWSKSIDNYYDIYVKGANSHLMLPLLWKFNLDPENKGEAQGWNLPGFNTSAWKDIRTDAVWETQGYGLKDGYGDSEFNGYDGFAWYRIDNVKVDEKHKDGKCFLKLGGVDESCVIWVNGQKAGSFQYDKTKNPDSWRETLSFDITGQVLYDAANSIAIRVEDKAGKGGIWKRAFLAFELPAREPKATAASGRNIFSDGFEAEGKFSKGGQDSSVEVVAGPAPEGKKSLHIHVDKPLPAECILDYPAIPVEGGRQYLASLHYRAKNVKENSGENRNWRKRPEIPHVRLLFKGGSDLKPLPDSIWFGGAFTTETGDWVAARKIFNAPPEAKTVSLTIFLQAEGDYWIDNIKLDEF